MITFESLGIEVKEGKTRWNAICPKCRDGRKPQNQSKLCLTVGNEPTNHWFHCNHCDWGGSLEKMNEFARVKEESGMPDQKRGLTIKAGNYLRKRGISIEVAKKVWLYNKPNKDNTLCFPFFMDFQIVNSKTLNLDWKDGSKFPRWFQVPKEFGSKSIPFGMQLMKTHDKDGKKIENSTCIISEGEIDMLTWMEAGYENVISVPMGAPNPKSKNFSREFAYIHEPFVRKMLNDIDTIYLAVDDDKAGEVLRYHLGMILGKEKCKIVKYPVGYKDINEVFVGHEKKKLPKLGIEAVHKCFNDALAVPIEGIVRLEDIKADLLKIRKGGFVPGLGCGIPEIDKIFTVKKRLITFITGVPGAGKSTWLRWWLVNMVQHNAKENIKWGLYTPENRPTAREVAKITECLTGKYYEEGDKDSQSEELKDKSENWTMNHFHIIDPSRLSFETFGKKISADKVNTLESIMEYIIYLKKTQNIFGYVIDAWNKIEHNQPKYETESQYISRTLDRLLDFNVQWDLQGIIVAHPTKMEHSGWNYKMPTLYNISGSKAWNEKADIGIVIHRYQHKEMTRADADEKGLVWKDLDDDEKMLYFPNAANIIRTLKVRFDETGVKGRVRMNINDFSQFYLDTKEKKATPPPDRRIEGNSDLFDDEPEDDLDIIFPF